MGISNRRQLHAALAFVVRPLALAVVLTVVVRLFFAGSPGAPKAGSSLLGTKTTFSKALVVASTRAQPEKEVGWIKEVPRDWEVFNYVTDAAPGTLPPRAGNQQLLSVPANKGNEAMAYLTHIIDHYDKLADVVLFHHSHRKSWHQELDSLTEVRSLRPSYVARKGYASTRCLPGCENVIPLADFAADFSLFPRIGRDVQLASLLHEFMDNDRRANQGVDDDAFLSGITKLAAPCCSQFAASRHAIRARSREWWMRLRQWLIDTPLDNRTSGRLLEYTWHIWLGEEPFQ